MATTDSLIGKHILVGLTYLAKDGAAPEQVQLHGVIQSVEGHLLRFERADGEGVFTIPFDGQLQPAQEGAVYTLRSTGEKVSNVDFVSTFTIHPPGSSDPDVA